MTNVGDPGNRSPGDPAPGIHPGDARPGSRRLDRPPSDRFGSAAGPTAGSGPRLRRGVALGSAAAIVVAIVWVLLAGVADISWGMIAVAVAGGWLIGSWAAYGCWGEAPHPPDVRCRELAVAFSLGAWLAGWVGTYLWTRAILPGSTLDLAGRIAQTPFPTWFAGLFGPVEALEIVVIAAIAWRTAR